MSPSMDVPTRLTCRLKGVATARFFHGGGGLRTTFSVGDPYGVIKVVLGFFRGLGGALPFFLFRVAVFIGCVEGCYFQRSYFSYGVFSYCFLSSALRYSIPFQVAFLVCAQICVFFGSCASVSTYMVFLVVLHGLLPLRQGRRGCRLIFLRDRHSRRVVSTTIRGDL